MQSSKVQIDWSVFKQQLQCNQDGDDPIKDCIAVYRLTEAIKHYMMLDITKSKDARDKLCTFFGEVYMHFLDDFTHLIHEHNNLEAIHNALITTALFDICDIKKCHFTARYHSQSKMLYISLDNVLRFYAQTIDSLHFYIFHLFECGLRTKRENDDHQTDCKHQDDNEYFDNAPRIMQERKHMCLSFQRFKNNNKFNINIQQSENEYKTESTQKVFETGKKFWYWPHYKDNSNFVIPKHKSLKDEILSTSSIEETMDIITSMSIKANKYLDTKQSKELKCNNLNYLKYDIKKGSPITYNHICSLVLYTDYTTLSAMFSATFRAVSTKESAVSIKQRNSEYAHWSRLLRECVELYGKCRGIRGKGIKGPFYSGLNDKFLISSFAILIAAPTSSSKQITVAMRFASNTERDGIIIVLNNYGKVNTFAAGWISNFKYEDEYIFMGATGAIKIQSIIINRRNYRKFIHSLYLFDCMISGIELNKNMESVSSTNYKIIKELISSKTKGSKCKFDEYIVSCWDLLCETRQELCIDYVRIIRHLPRLCDLVIGNVMRNTDIDEDTDINAMSSAIFGLFAHLKDIKIISSDIDGVEYYPFNIYSLMKNISGHNIKSLSISTSSEAIWFKDVRFDEKQMIFNVRTETDKFGMTVLIFERK